MIRRVRPDRSKAPNLDWLRPGLTPGNQFAFRRRLVFLSALVSIVAVAIVAQMVRLQGSAGDKLVAEGKSKRTNTYKVEAQRGSILDRNGVELAVSIPRRTLAVNMAHLAEAGIAEWADFESFGRELAPFVEMSPEDVTARLKDAAGDDPYVIIARNVPISLINKMLEKYRAEAKKYWEGEGGRNLLPALLVERASERINPAGDSGLRLIGKLGTEGPSEMAGIEKAFDKELRGVDGESRVELKNGSDRQLVGWSAMVNGEGQIDLSRKVGAFPGSEQVITEAVPGSSIQLTIDRAMQHDVERILIDGAAKAGARRGVAVVGKPATGELLAVASVEVDEKTGVMGLSNAPLAFANSYQAGSVFKLVTVAAGIESGEVTPQTVLEVPDRYKVSDRYYTDHDPHPTEGMSVTDIVAKSSNVGTIMIAQKLGKQRLYDALRGFGFGSKTGIHHPAEAAGLVPDYKDWTDPDLASSSIGTHESATALQLWSAYNVVANDGMYVAPRFVDAIVHPDGTRSTPKVAEPRRVLSKKTANAVSGVLQSVVTEGTAKQWTLPGYSIAAKTGTSRMPSPKRIDPRDGYKWEDGYHYLAAFTGYLSASRPQVSITVILDDVNTGLYGSTAAGPVFSQIARLSIRKLGIAPDEDAKNSGDTAVLPGTERVGGRIRTAPAARATKVTVPTGATATATTSKKSSTTTSTVPAESTPEGATSTDDSGSVASEQGGEAAANAGTKASTGPPGQSEGDG